MVVAFVGDMRDLLNIWGTVTQIDGDMKAVIGGCRTAMRYARAHIQNIARIQIKLGQDGAHLFFAQWRIAEVAALLRVMNMPVLSAGYLNDQDIIAVSMTGIGLVAFLLKKSFGIAQGAGK